MSDLTIYRINLDPNPDLPTGRYLANDSDLVSYLKYRNVLVPDTRLQAIADAWKLYRELHRIDPSSNETEEAWKLAIALLDALTKEDTDD